MGFLERAICKGVSDAVGKAIGGAVQKAASNAAVMELWEKKLPQYPKWSCGGTDYNLETLDGGYIMFAASFSGEVNQAYTAVRQYRELLIQNGFRQAGEYPNVEHLYKRVDGICFHADTEHCFDGDGDCPTLYFNVSEPSGGYDYVKPQPKSKTSLKDLFNFK